MSGKRNKKIRRRAKELVEAKLQQYPKKRNLANILYKQTGKLIKAGVLTICLVLVTCTCHADKVGLPTINPAKFIKVMGEKGYIIDTKLIDKKKGSFGLLTFDDRGMCIQTYRSIDTQTDLAVIQESIWLSSEE